MTTSASQLEIATACPPAIKKEATGDVGVLSNAMNDQVPYSIFTLNEKRFMVFIATFASLFSPISGTIYYPALTSIASELHVSGTLVNLTITTYMILQGLAPAFIGAFSDAEGRRPAYLICFVVYVAANIGLALQNSYAALLVLRCIQSSGSSGTIALASAVVADFSMPHERGRYMGWANAGALLGPTIGPIVGGVLTQYLGWRSIFWFLTIFAGVYLLLIVLSFPEPCRAVVGNGSHRPPIWNSCLLDSILKKRIAADPTIIGPPIPPHPLRFPNPLKTLAVLFDKEASLVLFSSGLLFAGFYMLMAVIPYQLQERYGYDSLHVGLVFIASGVGGAIAAPVNGFLMDWNFRRHATKLGLEASDIRRLRKLTSFPIEAARMELALPFIILGSAIILAFGWVLQHHTHIAGPAILLFFAGICTTGAFTVLATLLVDLYPDTPATASAAGNMTRCWLGAGATALVVPLVNSIYMGWAFTAVAALWLLLVPPLWVVVKLGPKMRREREEKAKARERAMAER